MTAQFGRLVEVEVRQGWGDEARDFTPWLASNLANLGEVLGVKLEVEGSEVPVGRYSADILARNPLDGSKVLIENQLECSDHKHLGQIMTYLAGLEAKIIVWVATSFTADHLSAIKWLNDHTEEGYSFFAVKVKVVQIGQSDLAPVFEVIERPNEWERQLHAVAAGGGRSELAQKRFDFWNAFVDAVPGERERNGDASYTSNRWRKLSEPNLMISMFTAKGSVGLFIRHPHYGSAEDAKELLAQKATALSAELGVPMGDTDWSHFTCERAGDYNDPAQRGELIAWLASKADEYERALIKVFGASSGTDVAQVSVDSEK